MQKYALRKEGRKGKTGKIYVPFDLVFELQSFSWCDTPLFPFLDTFFLSFSLSLSREKQSSLELPRNFSIQLIRSTNRWPRNVEDYQDYRDHQQDQRKVEVPRDDPIFRQSFSITHRRYTFAPQSVTLKTRG